MKNDFEIIQHRFDDDIIIYPISDVHFGALEHNKKAWKEFCEMVLESDNIYLTLGGDLINNATKSSVSNVFDEIVRPRDQKRIMAEMLEPLKDRILCAVPGNHERRSIKDADDEPVYDIMCKLGLEDLYRPNMAFVKIGIGTRSGKTANNRAETTYVLGVTHGAGGGAFTGSTVNKNERFGNIIEGLDCLIVGHTHKGAVTHPGKIIVDTSNNVVRVSDYAMVSSVSWQEFGGYALRGMLQPSSTCNPQRIALRKIAKSKPKRVEIIW